MNKILGEVSAASIDGNIYSLRLDFNALCYFEDVSGITATEALTAIGENKCSFKMLRQLVFAALKNNHPSASEKTAGDILSNDIGVIAKLVTSAIPQDETAEAEIEQTEKQQKKTKA